MFYLRDVMRVAEEKKKKIPLVPLSNNLRMFGKVWP
jgi:hypothetical protein